MTERSSMQHNDDIGAAPHGTVLPFSSNILLKGLAYIKL